MVPSHAVVDESGLIALVDDVRKTASWCVHYLKFFLAINYLPFFFVGVTLMVSSSRSPLCGRPKNSWKRSMASSMVALSCLPWFSSSK